MGTLILRWEKLVEPLAAWYGLDPRVVYAVMQLESAGKSEAVSVAGAVGLMQVMPREAGPMFRDRPTQSDLFDPAVNVIYGCKILKVGINALQGNLQEGVCAYFMGVMGIRRRGLESQDAQTYLTAFGRAWKELYPGMALPWDQSEGLEEEA